MNLLPVPEVVLWQIVVFGLPVVEHTQFANTCGLFDMKGLNLFFIIFGLISQDYHDLLELPTFGEAVLTWFLNQWGVRDAANQAHAIFLFHGPGIRSSYIVQYEIGRLTMLASLAKLTTNILGNVLSTVLAGGAATAMHELQAGKEPRPAWSLEPANLVHSGDMDLFIHSVELCDLGFMMTVIRRLVALLFGAKVLVLPTMGVSFSIRDLFAKEAGSGSIIDLNSGSSKTIHALDVSHIAFGGQKVYDDLQSSLNPEGARTVQTMTIEMFGANTPTIRVQLILNSPIPDPTQSLLMRSNASEMMELTVNACEDLNLQVENEAQVLIDANAMRIVENFDNTAVLVVFTCVKVLSSLGHELFMPLALPINRRLHVCHTRRVLSGEPGRHRARFLIQRWMVQLRSPEVLLIPPWYVVNLQHRVVKYCTRLGYDVDDSILFP